MDGEKKDVDKDKDKDKGVDKDKDKTPSTPRLTGSLAAPGTHDDAITRLQFIYF